MWQSETTKGTKISKIILLDFLPLLVSKKREEKNPYLTPVK
jgi:hypothetical protein